MRHSKTVRNGFNVNTKSIVLDDITADFLSNLRELRKTHGFTQKFIAEYADIPRTCVTCYENGTSVPSLRTLIMLAEILGADISGSVNYKFFYKKINTGSIKKSMRVYGLSFVEISSLVGYSPENVSLAVRAKPNASLHCLHAIIQLIQREHTAYLVRRHLTSKKDGDNNA